MACELDHLFVLTAVGAPDAARLVDFGLTEGAANVHEGQGTANRRFFFHNAMLELVWVRNPQEAQSALVRPTYLWERWNGRCGTACPFGLCFRGTGPDAGAPPFHVWEYRPPYSPPILIGANVGMLTEPFLCYFPASVRPEARPLAERQPMNHSAGVREITRLHLVGPFTGETSRELLAVVHAGLVTVDVEPRYRLDVGFDGDVGGRVADFQPALPLVFRW